MSGCMHPMLSITGSIVCQFYVTFTSICVCMCSCLFFMKSLTHDFDYIDNFVTFCFMLGGVINYKNNFKNKQFKQGFAGTTCYWVYRPLTGCFGNMREFKAEQHSRLIPQDNFLLIANEFWRQMINSVSITKWIPRLFSSVFIRSHLGTKWVHNAYIFNHFLHIFYFIMMA